MKKKSIFIVLLFLLISFSLFIFSPKTFAVTMKQGWKKINGKWYFYESGKKRVNDIFETDGYYYYVGKDGVMYSNQWYQDLSTKDKYWYWACSDGSLAQGWKKVNGKWYYFNQSYGKPYMLKGPQHVDNKYFLFDSSGALVEKTGWAKYDGKYYWLTGGGTNNTIFKGDWKFTGGLWYYLDRETGEMYDKPMRIDGKVEFFSGSGAWKKKPASGWFECKRSGYSDWYYVKNGTTFTDDWKFISGVWYYFDSDGLMYNHPTKVDGKIECFKASGAWVKTPANGWFGVANKKEKTTDWWYIVDHKVTTGWITDKGNRYHLDDYTGKMDVNKEVYNSSEGYGNYYYVGSSGAIKKDYWVYDKYAGTYAFSYYDKTGKKANPGGGWHFIKSVNAWFYFDSWGGISKNCVEEIDGKVYMFDEEGKMLSNGWHKFEDVMDASGSWFIDFYYTEGDEVFPYEFYLDSSGAARANSYIDGYHTDKYGRKEV